MSHSTAAAALLNKLKPRLLLHRDFLMLTATLLPREVEVVVSMAGGLDGLTRSGADWLRVDLEKALPWCAKVMSLIEGRGLAPTEVLVLGEDRISLTAAGRAFVEEITPPSWKAAAH